MHLSFSKFSTDITIKRLSFFILNMQPIRLEFADTYFIETLKSARSKMIVSLTDGDQSLLMREFSISYFTQ